MALATTGRHCLCPPPTALIISVEHDEVVNFELHEIEVARFADFLTVDELRERAVPQLTTIEELFARLQAHLKDNSVYDIRASYHPIYGYPQDVTVDFIRDIADEEISYSIPIFHLDSL